MFYSHLLKKQCLPDVTHTPYLLVFITIIAGGCCTEQYTSTSICLIKTNLHDFMSFFFSFSPHYKIKLNKTVSLQFLQQYDLHICKIYNNNNNNNKNNKNVFW